MLFWGCEGRSHFAEGLMMNLKGHNLEKPRKVNILSKIMMEREGGEGWLNRVYLENKEQIILSEKRTLLGEQEGTWQEYLCFKKFLSN